MEVSLLGLLLGFIAATRLTRLNIRSLAIVKQKRVGAAVWYASGVRLCEWVYFVFYTGLLSVYRPQLQQWAVWSVVMAVLLLYIGVRHLRQRDVVFPTDLPQTEKRVSLFFRGFMKKLLTIRAPLRWFCLSVVIMFTFKDVSLWEVWLMAAVAMWVFTVCFLNVSARLGESMQLQYMRVMNVGGNLAMIGLASVNLMSHLKF